MTRRRLITLIVAVTLLALFIGWRVFQPDRSHLDVDGKPYFWAGINYPWKSYQDFGTGAWGHSGVSSPASNAEIDADFAAMSAAGVRSVKWRLFSDGRYSPTFSADGSVSGLDDVFFADLDAALEIARRHGIRLIFTLFASGFWTTDQEQDGVRIGGHRDVLEDPQKRAELQAKVIVPLLEHVGQVDPSRVLAYEIIAEPEWGIRETNSDDDGRIKVSLSAVRSFVKETVDSIHSQSAALATVEANRPSNLKRWRGLGLDYYSFSWYDWMEPWESLRYLDTFTHLDRPVVLGEFPLAGSRYYATADALDLAYRQGLAGAFAWSYWGGDGCGPWSVAQPAFSTWVAAHWIDVRLSQDDGEVPSSEPPPAPLYTLGEPKLALAGNTVTVQLDARSRESGRYLVKLYLSKPADKQPEFEAEAGLLDDRPDSLLSVRFDSLIEDQSYKLSIGLFDASSKALLKWVDAALIFSFRADTLHLVPAPGSSTDHVCLDMPATPAQPHVTPTPTP